MEHREPDRDMGRCSAEWYLGIYSKKNNKLVVNGGYQKVMHNELNRTAPLPPNAQKRLLETLARRGFCPSPSTVAKFCIHVTLPTYPVTHCHLIVAGADLGQWRWTWFQSVNAVQQLYWDKGTPNFTPNA